jgi:hypothetical protein
MIPHSPFLSKVLDPQLDLPGLTLNLNAGSLDVSGVVSTFLQARGGMGGMTGFSASVMYSKTTRRRLIRRGFAYSDTLNST